MDKLPVITLGTHRISNPAPGEPPFLSAASGSAWTGRRLYSVGDDQAAVARRLGLAAGRTTRPRTALGARATGFAAAGWAVVVARGRATARGAGPVTLTLKPTPAARSTPTRSPPTGTAAPPARGSRSGGCRG